MAIEGEVHPMKYALKYLLNFRLSVFLAGTLIILVTIATSHAVPKEIANTAFAANLEYAEFKNGFSLYNPFISLENNVYDGQVVHIQITRLDSPIHFILQLTRGTRHINLLNIIVKTDSSITIPINKSTSGEGLRVEITRVETNFTAGFLRITREGWPNLFTPPLIAIGVTLLFSIAFNFNDHRRKGRNKRMSQSLEPGPDQPSIFLRLVLAFSYEWKKMDPILILPWLFYLLFTFRSVPVWNTVEVIRDGRPTFEYSFDMEVTSLFSNTWKFFITIVVTFLLPSLFYREIFDRDTILQTYPLRSEFRKVAMMGTSMVYLGSSALLYGYLLLSRTVEAGTTISDGAILMVSVLFLFTLLIWTTLYLIVLFLSNHSAKVAVPGWILTTLLCASLSNFPLRVGLLLGWFSGVVIPVPVITHLFDRIIVLVFLLALLLAVPDSSAPNSSRPNFPLLQRLKEK